MAQRRLPVRQAAPATFHRAVAQSERLQVVGSTPDPAVEEMDEDTMVIHTALMAGYQSSSGSTPDPEDLQWIHDFLNTIVSSSSSSSSSRGSGYAAPPSPFKAAANKAQVAKWILTHLKHF